MKNHKLIIIIVALAVVAVGAYLYFSGSMKNAPSKQPTGTLTSTTTGESPTTIGDTAPAAPIAGSEIASLLKNISSIRLDDRILTNPSFLALVDSSIALPQIEVSGRVNPFGRTSALDNSTPSQTVINTSASSGATTTR
jgi:hypothetical protein